MLARQMNNKDPHVGKLSKAKEYALRVISHRPRTVWEIDKKLADKGYDSEIIALVIAFLKEYSFLDDESFTRMWIRSRTIGKPSGPRRIYAELVQKRVDRELIEQHLAGLTPEKEEEMAIRLVESRCRKTGFNYNRLQGFLLRRGFNPGAVKKVLSECEKNYKE